MATPYYTKAESDALDKEVKESVSSGIINSIETTSPAPTQDGIYPCTESGTYLNFGNEIVSLDNQIVSILVEDNLTTFTQLVTPIGLTIDSVPTLGSTNAVESGGVKILTDAVQSIVSTFTDKAPLSSSASPISILNTGILREDGTINSGATSYNVSDFITSTEGNDKFIQLDFGTPTGLSNFKNICYYDENDVFIIGLLINGVRTIGVPYPYKVKLSTRTELTSSAIESNELTEYSPTTELEIGLSTKVNSKLGVNLLDVSTILDGNGYSLSGSLLSNPSWVGSYGATEKIYFNGNSQLTCNSVATGGFYSHIYDINDNILSSQSTSTITNVSGGVYAKFSLALGGDIQIEYGATSTTYQAYSPIAGYLDSSGANIELFAYADGTSADTDTIFYGVKNNLTSIQRAINSCDDKNNYIINCFGKFKFTSSTEFFEDIGSGYKYMVYINPNQKNITLQGQGMDRTSLECSLPSNLTTGFDYDKYITLELLGNNCYVKDMSISCENMRYPVHIDKSSSNVCNNYTLGLDNVRMRHKGNQGDALSVWISNAPLGLGISSGMDLTLDSCELICDKDFNPFYIHDNHSFDKPFYFRIKNTKGISLGSSASSGVKNAFTFQILGANVAGNVVFENVDFGGRYQFYYDNKNTSLHPTLASYDPKLFTKIVGNVDIPLLHLPINSKGRVLKITSNSTSTSSTVRFDDSSSAFPILVKGVDSIDYTDRNGTVGIDGYNYNDGAESLNGWARGELALDIGTIADLSSRLGDRTSSPISLGIIIDGTTYTVTFNADYTSFTDQQILDVIDVALSGNGVASLYDWGADYHAEFPKCMSEGRNLSTYTIKNGMGIKLDNSGIYPAETNADVDAIALDDIKPDSFGRYATKELLYTYDSNRYFIKLENQGNVTKGTKLSIGSNRGVFVVDNTTGILEAIYSNTIEINN